MSGTGSRRIRRGSTALALNHDIGVYQLVRAGVDRPLGRCLEGPVTVPASIDWYARHADLEIPDEFLAIVVDELVAADVPGLSLAGCRRLTVASSLPLRRWSGLETLDLFNSSFDEAALIQLVHGASLRNLNLAGTSVTAAVLERIAALPALEYLHLGWTDVDDDALARLAAHPSLCHLNLRGTRVTDQGLAALSALPRLETLDLQETGIGDRGVMVLETLAERLRALYLGYTRISDASLDSLRRQSGLHTLMLRASGVGREHDDDIATWLADNVARRQTSIASDGERTGLIR